MISHIRMSEDRKKCSDNLSQRSIYQAKVIKRKEELLKAVNYCVENNCRGSKAISSGLFTGLKCYKTIDNIIDQKSKDPHHAKEYCSVLSYEEECLLVKFLVNKARAYQPYNRKDITKYIIQLLTLRRDFNKAAKGGGVFVNANGRTVLTQNTFFNNEASDRGSAYYITNTMTDPVSTIISSVFEQNKVHHYGTIYLIESSLSVDDITLDGNTTTDQTAGIA